MCERCFDIAIKRSPKKVLNLVQMCKESPKTQFNLVCLYCSFLSPINIIPDMNLHNYLVLQVADSFQPNAGVSITNAMFYLLQICAEALIVFKYSL